MWSAGHVSRWRTDHWPHTCTKSTGEHRTRTPRMDDGSWIRTDARGLDMQRFYVHRSYSLRFCTLHCSSMIYSPTFLGERKMLVLNANQIHALAPLQKAFRTGCVVPVGKWQECRRGGREYLSCGDSSHLVIIGTRRTGADNGRDKAVRHGLLPGSASRDAGSSAPSRQWRLSAHAATMMLRCSFRIRLMSTDRDGGHRVLC